MILPVLMSLSLLHFWVVRKCNEKRWIEVNLVSSSCFILDSFCVCGKLAIGKFFIIFPERLLRPTETNKKGQHNFTAPSTLNLTKILVYSWCVKDSISESVCWLVCCCCLFVESNFHMWFSLLSLKSTKSRKTFYDLVQGWLALLHRFHFLFVCTAKFPFFTTFCRNECNSHYWKERACGGGCCSSLVSGPTKMFWLVI